MNTIQEVHVLRLRAPELNTVQQVGPHKSRTEAINHLFCLLNLSERPIGLSYLLTTVVSVVKLKLVFTCKVSHLFGPIDRSQRGRQKQLGVEADVISREIFNP